jgi:hypothetical protein
MRHAIFRDKTLGPLGNNTHLQPLGDPPVKASIADGEILGAIVKDSLTKCFVLDAARRQPSTDAPTLVQHSNPHTLSLQNGGSGQSGQASTHNDTSLVSSAHAIASLGA